MISVDTVTIERVCQGDVIRDVEYCESAESIEGIIEVNKIIFPVVVVLTQDCDLLWDDTYRINEKPNDKWLMSVLLAPAYNADHLFSGVHLEELGIISEAFKRQSTDYKRIIQNKNPRYHYLEFPDEVHIVPSVIDFKHYFSAPVTYLRTLKRTNCACKLAPLYREDVCQRFSSYLSRIGLPNGQ
ncbi:MAG: hypothetical protein KJ649_09270 [Proteobacteria bacterium]|nr:hypothetical protein [Pseudomonadota bacterium]